MSCQDAVVVGVDGSARDQLALAWAAGEAVARNVGLWVVHCWEWSLQGRPVLPLDLRAAEPHTFEEGLVQGAAEAVRSAFPGLDVTGAVGYSRAVPSLLGMSDEASLMVVGARGHGGFPGLLLGSVSAQLAAHARCPVAVIRPPAGTATDVVVGVDGSTYSQQALNVALDEARRLEGRLLVVQSYQLPPLPADAPNPEIDEQAYRALAHHTLDRALDQLDQAVSEGKLERLIAAGPPARVLVEAAAGAAALVVGARGLGGFAGLVLGSVSQQVLRHAPGPVIVAH